MRALFSALAVGLLVLGSGSAMAQQSQGEPPFPPGAGVDQFVGFTDDVPTATDTINGGQGMLAMHALCHDDFGPDARMCTSKEFWLSPNAEAPGASAWMHAVGSGSFSRHSPDDIQIRGNRTTVPPPMELHPFRSHPMA